MESTLLFSQSEKYFGLKSANFRQPFGYSGWHTQLIFNLALADSGKLCLNSVFQSDATLIPFWRSRANTASFRFFRCESVSKFSTGAAAFW
jgi:hypothetical protein